MIKNILLISVVITIVACHVQTDIRYGRVKSKGVNLGGWLVAEHWMSSSSVIWDGVPEYLQNYGEFRVMEYWGHNNGDWRFEQHRQQWITEGDIAEIAGYGINTVRVPIGFWLPGYDPTGGSDWAVFTPGAINYLDKLVKNWAVKYNVAVMISIHAAKGSQNGNDHSAPTNPPNTYWSQYPENVRNTVDLAVFIANRYKNEVAFLGIGLLNEPSGSTDESTLRSYYRTAINEIRATGNDCILTVAPLLYQQDPDHFSDFAKGENHIWLEWHKYLIWGYEWMNEDQILNDAIPGIQNQFNSWQGNPIFTGEWSIATAGNAPFNDQNKFKDLGNKFRNTLTSGQGGWTYWTWKTSYDENSQFSSKNAWSLRQLLRNGWIAI